MSDDRPNFLELLQNNHEFPGTYMFKVIGEPADGFIARVLLLFRQELNLSSDPPFVLRQSSGGKYVAITLTPYMMTAEEVMDVYRRLHLLDGIVTYC